MKDHSIVSLGLIFSVALFTSCSPQTAQNSAPPPVVQDHQETTQEKKPAVSPEHNDVTAIEVEATLDKQALFGKTFLYGADLQYSSVYEAEDDLYMQSMAFNHVPVSFRIAGAELQLIADNRRLFPSDVNHPEQIISRFTILRQTESTLTVSAAHSGIYLATLAGDNKKTPPPRDLWVRSFQFDRADNLILQETSILLADGSIAEFMESIMPAASIAPGPRFETFEMDPTDPVGGTEGAVGRFRLLGGEKIFQGEKTLTFAQHFDLSPKADGRPSTIDWYVTANIPEEFVSAVRDGIEGWNRYFRSFQGIERDVMVFKGKLPQGIKLGDPRYNVVAWDNRLVAGAAYESQATDPFTGKQSHSLIYLPAAWLKIGMDYWKDGRTSEARTRHFSRLPCRHDLREAAAFLQSGKVAPTDIEEFGIRLLRGTLFHEVGHALGLAHNFKGSLSFDRSQAGSAFSTSIMDYNDFEIERDAFPKLDDSEGPALEYDRQTLSALYNGGRDIKASDAVVPTCNDEEADAEEGGVDPLCTRYDIEKDPTQSIATSFRRLNENALPQDTSLAQALQRIPHLVLSEKKIALATDAAAFAALVEELTSALNGSIRYFYLSGKASLSRVVRTNIKSLLVFQEEILPEGYNERLMRERVFSGVLQTLNLHALSKPAELALQAAISESISSLATTPFARSAPDSQKLLKTTEKELLAKISDWLSGPTGLPKLRAQVLAALARHSDVPFFFGKIEKTQLDFETAILGILTDASIHKNSHTLLERTMAVTSLGSFKGRPGADALLHKVQKRLLEERASAKDNESREAAHALLTILEKSK